MQFNSQDEFLNHSKLRVEKTLNTAISGNKASELLSEAMAYSAGQGGKRVRAALVYGAARACGVQGPHERSRLRHHVCAATSCSHYIPCLLQCHGTLASRGLLQESVKLSKILGRMLLGHIA